MTAEEWFGRLQGELEALIAIAPDAKCRAFAEDLWQQTAEDTDDEPPEAA